MRRACGLLRTRVPTRPIKALAMSVRTVRPTAAAKPLRAFTTSRAARGHGHAEEVRPEKFVRLVFVDMYGGRQVIEKARVGDNLLQVARTNKIPIPGDCEGASPPESLFGEGPMCRSCYVYIPLDFMDKIDKVSPMSQKEWDEGKFIPDRNKNMRFACEVEVTEDLDGMTVALPIYPPDPDSRE